MVQRWVDNSEVNDILILQTRFPGLRILSIRKKKMEKRKKVAKPNFKLSKFVENSAGFYGTILSA